MDGWVVWSPVLGGKTGRYGRGGVPGIAHYLRTLCVIEFSLPYKKKRKEDSVGLRAISQTLPVKILRISLSRLQGDTWKRDPTSTLVTDRFLTIPHSI